MNAGGRRGFEGRVAVTTIAADVMCSDLSHPRRSDLTAQDASPTGEGRQHWLLLALVCLVFLAVRVPVMYLQPGGQDEDCYAVPGLTILDGGIPRLPHVPSRNPESVYYRADDVLFAEPPLYFYVQSLFYLVLPAVYGTARLASGVAGVILLCFVYRLCRAVGGSPVAALWAAAFLSLSRWFYFPAISARPDILCAGFGIAVFLLVLRWQRTSRFADLVLAGLCIGLGGLTHPFAIVYAIQAAVWVAVCSHGWRRVGHPLAMACIAIITCSLWLPLIAMSPQVFTIQFANQFLSDTGPPIWQRAVFPWESISFHCGHLWRHIGAFQFSLALFGLVAVSIAGFRSANARLITISSLGWSTIYLLSIAVGTHHQVLGYWVYFAALAFVCVGIALERLLRLLPLLTAGSADVSVLPPHDQPSGENVSRGTPPSPAKPRSRWKRAGAAYCAVTIVGLVALIPGSGLRTLAVHVRHLGNPDYNSPQFAQQLMDQLPEDAIYAVDPQFVLDFIAADRHTILAQSLPRYFRVQDFDYDFLIISRSGIDSNLAQQLSADLVQTYGVRDDKMACYAEVHSHAAP